MKQDCLLSRLLLFFLRRLSLAPLSLLFPRATLLIGEASREEGGMVEAEDNGMGFNFVRSLRS